MAPLLSTPNSASLRKLPTQSSRNCACHYAYPPPESSALQSSLPSLNRSISRPRSMRAPGGSSHTQNSST
jgi:hypothetical protein